MAIIIPNHRITIPQMVKLFSNPVSGIACIMDPKSNYNLAHGGYYHLRNIRYSKSMILGALSFWGNQLFNFYLKITRINNPLEPTRDTGNEVMKVVSYFGECTEFIRNLPDSFLFSHRYIEQIDEKKYSEGMKIQKKLIQNKHSKILNINSVLFQKTTVEPFIKSSFNYYNLSFTVFPNEHPYIRRTVISEVGQTKNGNTFVIKRND